MKLEEALQKLEILIEEEHALLKEIKKKHIHNENDELVYFRYKNADNAQIREYISKRIEEGKDWKELLDEYPMPDKPFHIEDIQDATMKTFFMRIIDLEKEEKVLGDYINKNYEYPEINQRIEQYFNDKYGLTKYETNQ